MALRKLLEDPFGPYPDAYILNPKWPWRGVQGYTRPTLTSVQMRCAGEDIGLNETELLDEAPKTSRIVQHPVEIMGVLEIEKLDWLSDTGRSWLSYDLKKRDEEKSTSGRASQLTLEAVYGDGINSGSTISVWVKFEKALSAAYMTLNDDPMTLVLFTKDQNRSFRVWTLDSNTFELSRNFIERYTIRRLIQELIDGSDAPVTDRNIDWIVQQYFKQVIPLDRNIRYIFNPNVPNIVTNRRGAMKLGIPRHPRHVHKAEIVKIFSRHAEWILADQIVSLQSPHARYLDIPQWFTFVRQIKHGPSGLRQNDIMTIADSLTKFGGKREVWKQRLNNALASPLHWQQRRELEERSRRAAPRSTPRSDPLLGHTKSFSEQLVQPPKSPRIAPAIEYQYDSDFSEASTPGASDSESESDDQELINRVPWFCGVPPTIEVSQHVWRCPGCRNYQIDFLHPNNEELDQVPEYYARILRSRAWQKVTDPGVLGGLGHLISNHYAAHLRSLGIQFVSEGDKVSVRKWPEKKRRRSQRLNK